jgi:hypothetical protein
VALRRGRPASPPDEPIIIVRLALSTAPRYAHADEFAASDRRTGG